MLGLLQGRCERPAGDALAADDGADRDAQTEDVAHQLGHRALCCPETECVTILASH